MDVRLSPNRAPPHFQSPSPTATQPQLKAKQWSQLSLDIKTSVSLKKEKREKVGLYQSRSTPRKFVDPSASNLLCLFTALRIEK